MKLTSQTIAFHTLGCKLNFSETSTIARDLKAQGFSEVSFQHKADVYVINTCSVTENADRECKKIVKKVKRQNPEGFVVIIGCYAQLKPKEISEIEGVDLVLGAQEKFNLATYLKETKNNEQQAEVHSCEIEEVNFYQSAYSIGSRTRAFLKVQDGCDYKCSYCTIPLARGISRSDTVENILRQAKEIEQKGIREVVLTGVNIGDYGKGEEGNKKHEHTFLELIQALDAKTSLERIRISSIEPNLLSPEIIDFVASSQRFVPHFHIPLQSGSDEILRKMRRRYRSDIYIDRVQRIKDRIPSACIGSDVIVGFPGETQAHFMETYQLVQELPVDYLHVFTYSERINTKAYEMKGVVPIPERKKRNKQLRILSEKKRMAFYRAHLGETAEVLWEAEKKEGRMLGYTQNYIRASIPYDEALVNQSTPVDLVMLQADGTLGVQVVSGL